LFYNDTVFEPPTPAASDFDLVVFASPDFSDATASDREPLIERRFASLERFRAYLRIAKCWWRLVTFGVAIPAFEDAVLDVLFGRFAATALTGFAVWVECPWHSVTS
jgi:hypothetical protein